MKSHGNSIFFRQSHNILILRLLVAELIIIAINFSIKLPQLFSLTLVNTTEVIQSITLTGVILFGLLSIGELFIVLYITLTWANEEYEIRDGAVRHRRGVFHIKEEVYSLRNLGSATINQSLIGRILNYGTIHAYSPILKQEIYLLNVHNPNDILRHLEDDVEHAGGRHDVFRRGN